MASNTPARGLRLAVIGVGHLGKEHARILAQLPGADLVGVADIDPELAQTAARKCGCKAFSNYRSLLHLVDAAVIAVPTTHHHAIASEFLRCGISVMVEKPLAATVAQAEQLVELARRHRAILQVGHIERFNPALEELRRYACAPKFIRSERLGSFTGRSTDIGVVLDLMIHDLDIVLSVVSSTVRSVAALGVSVFGEQEDVANARLTFENGCVADITASRASYVSRRAMQIWCPEGFVSIDFGERSLRFVQPSEHVRRHGLDPRQLDAASRALVKQELFEKYLQVMDHRCLTTNDPLTRELQHFVQSVRSGTRPMVSGEEGLDAMALAERVLTCIREHAWEGRADGPVGPGQCPEPLASFFQPGVNKMAA